MGSQHLLPRQADPQGRLRLAADLLRLDRAQAGMVPAAGPVAGGAGELFAHHAVGGAPRSEAERKVLMFILIVARSEAESQKRSAAERNAYALLSRNCLCTISEAKNSFCILTKVSLILLKNP